MSTPQKADLMKEAADRIKTLTLQNQEAIEKMAGLERREEAEKVAWDLVGKGLCDPYKTQTDFEEKIAAILSRGAEIVRAGMDLAPKLGDFGTLSHEKTAGADLDPLTAFVLSGD